MPKMSKTQIHQDEKKLLRILRQNSGDSIDNLAKKCDFSRQKVWRSKKRLEDNNTIWGYTAVVDDEKVDKNRYLLLAKRSNQPMDNAIDKITKLTAVKKGEEVGIEILSVGYMHGEYDMAVVLSADNITNVKKFKELVFTTFPDLLSKIDILEYVFLLRDGGITNPEIEKIKEFF